MTQVILFLLMIGRSVGLSAYAGYRQELQAKALRVRRRGQSWSDRMADGMPVHRPQLPNRADNEGDHR